MTDLDSSYGLVLTCLRMDIVDGEYIILADFHKKKRDMNNLSTKSCG